MKISNIIISSLFLATALVSCQNKDLDVAVPAIVKPIEAGNIIGSLEGDDYVWSWTGNGNCKMQVNVYDNKTLILSEVVGTHSFSHRNVDTNIEYTYVFKLTDGSNISSGVIKRYTRPGASRISGLSMSQIDKTGGYDAGIVWDANPTAEMFELTATNGGSRTINETLPATTVSYLVPDVRIGEEWTVTVTAVNADGPSLPVSTSLKIGKTAIGFLGVYPDEHTLVSDGDDDEASAWLWLHEEYPTAEYVYFGDIASDADLDNYRVLFWLRDLTDVSDDEVFAMPEVVEQATPFVRAWYAAGGNLLLWSHATVYVGTLGRIDMNMLRGNDHVAATGRGSYNADTWSMAISLNPGSKFTKDHSSHPIYKGLTVNSNDRCKLVPFKGEGWTEDHNCLFFNIPAALTGLGNQDEECYNELTRTFGIYTLGTWDSQIDFVSQLNVWEAQQGNTEFKGTILCIGNGGCEFSLNNPDGTPDVSAHPKNNPYQDNVLQLAKNALEYLKTR